MLPGVVGSQKPPGFYVFARDIALSAFYNFRDGAPMSREILSPSRGGIGTD